jgi:ribosomal protein L23
MDLKLYNQFQQYLQEFSKYQDRLDCVNEKILLHKKHGTYYNYQYPNLSEGQTQGIIKRWLGIKYINKPYPNEHTKIILDSISTYLLGCKQYSAKPLIKEYVELIKCDNLTPEQVNRLNLLESCFIYKKKYYNKKRKEKYKIFFINHKAELLLKNSPIGKQRYYKAYDCKDKALENIEFVKEFELKRQDLIQEIRREYNNLKENDDFIVSNILKLSLKIKKINSDIRYSEQKIDDLYKDYLSCTELMCKNK